MHASLGGRKVIGRAVDALGVSKAAAIGHLVMFWGQLSALGVDGSIADVSDAQIEDWAGWVGKRGKFAAFVRARHTDAEGRVNDWDEYHGVLEHRRAADAARQRERRERLRAARQNGQSPPPRPLDVTRDSPRDISRTSAGRHADRPRDNRVTSIPPRANDTKREENYELQDQDLKLQSGLVDLQAPPAPIPPLSLARNRTAEHRRPIGFVQPTAFGVHDLPREACEFVRRFYAPSSDRGRDVVRQLVALLNGGTPYRGSVVRAHPDPTKAVDRLAAKCRSVTTAEVHDPDKAIAILLAKLSNTDEDNAPGDYQRLREHADDVQARLDLTTAAAWLATCPATAAAIDQRLDALFPPGGEFAQLGRRLARDAALLDAWRSRPHEARVPAGTP